MCKHVLIFIGFISKSKLEEKKKNTNNLAAIKLNLNPEEGEQQISHSFSVIKAQQWGKMFSQSHVKLIAVVLGPRGSCLLYVQAVRQARFISTTRRTCREAPAKLLTRDLRPVSRGWVTTADTRHRPRHF